MVAEGLVHAMKVKVRGDIFVLGKPFASGKQGELHVHPGDPRLALKIYTVLTPEDEERIVWMAGNQLANRIAANGKPLFTWPLEVVKDPATGRVIGFTLELLDDYVPLQRIYDPATRLSAVTERFRLAAAASFCKAIFALHACGIVAGDISLSNALVDRHGHVCLIDTDSARIAAGHVVYPCRYGVLDYAAPELQGVVSFADVDRTVLHDRHAVAVVVFLLAMSTPPYCCHYVGRGQCPDDRERIRLGLWPYSGKHSDFQPPRSAPPFTALDARLQELFRLSFVAGYLNPADRPAPEEYADVLRAITDVGVVPAQIPAAAWQRHFTNGPFAAAFTHTVGPTTPQAQPVTQPATGRARTRRWWQVAAATVAAAAAVVGLWLAGSMPNTAGEYRPAAAAHAETTESSVGGHASSRFDDRPVLWRVLEGDP